MRNFTFAIFCCYCCHILHGQATSRIITDFGGYWSSTSASPNPVRPDSSHMLLGFTFGGITYSTGVNDGILITNGVTYTPGNWQAFPVADIAGSYGPGSGGGISNYIALASKVDRSPSAGNVPAVADYSIRTAMIDGIKGLDLGTGVTNLPATAVMNFRIFNIDPAAIDDDEPDILLTQIADPSSSLNDQFTFRDALGNQVGNAFTQDMSTLPSLGTYTVDLFNLTPNTPFNAATVYSIFQAHNNPVGTTRTRPIRVVAVRLSAFGITASNVGQIASLRVSPSGISDYAFIAYNANSINFSPNVAPNPALTNVAVCDNGIAHFAVVATAAQGGQLTYAWEESTDAGATWNPVVDGGNYSGATTDRLAVTDPVNGYRYRATVLESGNPNPVTSAAFEVSIITAPAAPATVSIAGGATICAGAPVQLTSTVTGGSNLYYEWQSAPAGSGTFTTIPGANLSTYVPPPGQTGSVDYRLRVSSGSACVPQLTSDIQSIVIDGIASVTPAERCGAGIVPLSASATSGTVNWYNADVGGTLVATGSSFSPTLSNTTTYYVANSPGCTGALRVPVTATISPTSTGGTLSGSVSMPAGGSATLTLAGFTGGISRWQSSTDGFSSNIVDIDNSSPMLTVDNLLQTTSYRVELQSGSCPVAYSSVATITVFALPVHIGSFTATVKEEGILVKWIAYNQQNTVQFDIQRSSDGINFTTVHTIPSTASAADATYEWLDRYPPEGRIYYRIKEVFTTGAYEYSTVVNVTYNQGGPRMIVYPNPVRDRNFSLELLNMSSGKYQLNYFSASGQLAWQQTITHNGDNRRYTLNIPQATSQGMYKLILIDGNGTAKTSVSLLVQ